MVKAALFATGGWTEYGALQIFLSKIIPNSTIDRCLPKGRVKKYKKKDRATTRLDGEGLTGAALVSEVLRRIKICPEEYEQFDVIIIEDDLDCRFFEKTEEEVQAYFAGVREKVNEALGLEKPIPVIFLYASPEIEAWFLADWNNTFAKAYGELIPSNSNSLFCYRLKKYIDDKILGNYQNDIESYGMIDGSYKKLSDQIVIAIDEIKMEFNTESEHKDKICENKEIRYSKTVQGIEMLRRADPDRVAQRCRRYFAPAVLQMKNLA